MTKLNLTKSEMITEFRALLNAIEATTEPTRIVTHLNEIRLKALKVSKSEIVNNPYWLNN